MVRSMDTSQPHTLDPDGVGHRLRAAREARGLTVNQLALHCNTSRQSVESYESGTTLPGARALARLALALRVTSDHILGLPKRRAS